METFSKAYVLEFPRELVFSRWVGSDETTEVDVTFQDHPDGTEIPVTHSGFKSVDSYENHGSGWDNYVAGFTAHIGQGD